MMLQRLATGATGVKQARYRRRPTEALARACAVYTHNASAMNVRPFQIPPRVLHFSALVIITSGNASALWASGSSQTLDYIACKFIPAASKECQQKKSIIVQKYIVRG